MRDISNKLSDAFNRVSIGAAGIAGGNSLLMAAMMNGSVSLIRTLLDQERVQKGLQMQMTTEEMRMARLAAVLNGSQKNMKKETDVDVVGMLMDISDTLFKDESQSQQEKAVQAEVLTR